MSDEDLQYYDMGYDDAMECLQPYYPGYHIYMIGYQDGLTDRGVVEYDMDDGS